MTGRVLDLDRLLVPDHLGTSISKFYINWETFRQEKIKQWEELRRYIYATDTRQTSNATLPWKNTTTVPKLCQIRDNLNANYMASIFPKRRWLVWEGGDKDSQAKAEAIKDYMSYVVEYDGFKKEIGKLVLDYIDYGNCFATVEWRDETQLLASTNMTKVGYVGPVIRRISPLDIVMNPTGSDFTNTPKIIRSLITKGECKEVLDRFTSDDTREMYESLWDYLKEIRVHASSIGSNTDKSKNDFYRVDGFTSFRNYLTSNYVELLTFYGDIYDEEKDEYLRNHVVVVADRHKVVWKGPNPS